VNNRFVGIFNKKSGRTRAGCPDDEAPGNRGDLSPARHGKPKVSTPQGRQFTSIGLTDLLRDNGIAISMDGKRRIGLSSTVCHKRWRNAENK
jgi:hypothetical protein